MVRLKKYVWLFDAIEIFDMNTLSFISPESIVIDILLAFLLPN